MDCLSTLTPDFRTSVNGEKKFASAVDGITKVENLAARDEVRLTLF
jgi:hypothetical protein